MTNVPEFGMCEQLVMPPSKKKKSASDTKVMPIKKDPTRRATIKSVAEAAGVSIATVSFVLNKRPGQVISEPVQKRVLEAVRKLDYAPSAAAATLARKQTTNVVIAFYMNNHLITNQFYSFVIQGAIKEAAEREYNILFSFMDREYESYEDLPKVIREKNAEGVLFIQEVSEPLIRVLQERGISVVGVDSHPRVDSLDSVYVDNERGATLACQRLIADGHTEVVMLTGGGRDVVSLEQRRSAFLKTLKTAGLNASARDNVIDAGALSFQAAYERSKTLLRDRPDVTGIFCANDEMAAGVLRAAHEMNRKIPESLSVIGFDDITMSHYVDPPLTTVSSDKEAIGRHAMAHLLARIEKKVEGPALKRLVEVELITRRSSGPLKTKSASARRK